MSAVVSERREWCVHASAEDEDKRHTFSFLYISFFLSILISHCIPFPFFLIFSTDLSLLALLHNMMNAAFPRAANERGDGGMEREREREGLCPLQLAVCSNASVAAVRAVLAVVCSQP